MNSLEALEKLKQGNARFINNVRGAEPILSQVRRADFVQGQSPFAVILGCSDSRVPAEIIFDQGLGDLFVIRVAGNIVAPSQIGSVEFAADRFGLRLVVVLSHSSCGAITATLEELNRGSKDQSRHMRSIVDRIRPSVQAFMGTSIANDQDVLIHHAVRANIRMSANHLRHGSDVLEQLIENNGLVGGGAEYDLETGVVEFFDGLP